MAILVADSGSTKTTWCLLTKGTKHFVQTQGINPYHQSQELIRQILTDELLPQLPIVDSLEVNFYGAGCSPEKSPLVTSILSAALSTLFVEVESDLLGAARALCQREEGIAAILGTGANSCLYNGMEITQNTPALGYILGDEGSGAVLGRLLVADLLKGVLPQALKERFLSHFSLTQADIIEQIYRQPMANRFMASFSPFLAEYRDLEEIKQLLHRAFCAFFTRNITPYRRPDLPVNFVGSIAYHFQEEIARAAEASGFQMGTILQDPIEALVSYHVGR